MFTMHKERVTRHPAVLFVLAAILGLYCSLLFGSDVRPHDEACPGPLPSDMDVIARPIDPVASPIAIMGRAIAAHEAGRLEEAVTHWQQLTVPHEAQVWSHLSVGAARLYQGKLNAAAVELDRALEADAENAIVHYFRGLLRREQAATAVDLRETATNSEVRRAFRAADDLQPLIPSRTQSQLRLDAITELELAIRYACELDPTQSLLADSAGNPATRTITGPNRAGPLVGELLDALGADNFVGKAHGLLAHLYLKRDCPEAAEPHVDQAQTHGIPVPSGYRLIGRMYEAQGRNADAVRAYQKAMLNGDGLANPGATDVEDMQRGFEDIL